MQRQWCQSFFASNFLSKKSDVYQDPFARTCGESSPAMLGVYVLSINIFFLQSNLSTLSLLCNFIRMGSSLSPKTIILLVHSAKA